MRVVLHLLRMLFVVCCVVSRNDFWCATQDSRAVEKCEQCEEDLKVWYKHFFGPETLLEGTPTSGKNLTWLCCYNLKAFRTKLELDSSYSKNAYNRNNIAVDSSYS